MNTLNIRRKIPECIKKRVRWFYHKLTMKIEKETIKDLMEYYSLDRKKVMHLLESSGRLSTDFWYCLNPKTQEDIRNVYIEDPFYVFNLTIWHATKVQIKLRKKMVELARGRVLDYGAGVGDMCIMAKERNLEVDYANLSGRVFNFAKWLFNRKGYTIPMVNLSVDRISKNYDTIFCIDVIEHVTDPKGLLKDFIGHLNNGGYLMITSLNPITGEDIPMHFGFDFDPEEYLKSLGMNKAEHQFLWVKGSKQ